MPGELILMRHAEAGAGLAGETDRDRELTANGRAQAQAATAWLQARQPVPQVIVHSPAARTRQTADALQAAFPRAERVVEEGIYLASAGELLALASQWPDCPCLLLLGHNPAIASAARVLTDAPPRPVPPATVMWLRLEQSLAEPGRGRLIAAWAP